jgi:TPR repeat protein
MKCIFCQICKAVKETAKKHQRAWSDAHINKRAVWEREADQERVHLAARLLHTDPGQSLKEYVALAEKGSLWSMICAGAMFEAVDGPQLDLAQAEKWYRRAYENGADDALLRLGRLYLRTGRYQKAEEIFKTGVERGFAPALYPLAWAYTRSGDWRQKRDEAFRLLKEASAAGDIGAKQFRAARWCAGGSVSAMLRAASVCSLRSRMIGLNS